MNDDVDLVELPHTWRPLGVRVVGAISGFALIALVTGAWFGFTDSIRAQFDWLQLGTLILLGGLALAVWFALMRCRVTASADGLLVVNGYHYYRFEWAQIVAVSLRRGAPWASLDLSDGSTLGVMAIQNADGGRAVAAAQQLKRLAAACSTT